MTVTTLSELVGLDVPPSIGDLITGPGQLEWRGLLLGEGTYYCTDTLTGWESLPGVDRSSVARARRHGAYPGTVLAQEKIINWSGSIFIDGASTYDARRALVAATRLRDDAVEEPLAVRTDDVTEFVWAQIIARVIPLTSPYRRWVTNVELQWACSDPRRYLIPDDGTGEHSVAVRLPVDGSGLTYPIAYPIDYGTAGDSGTRTADNDGSESTPIVATFWGEADSPQIIIVGPDGSRKVTTLELSLAAGEFVTVDARTGTVLLGGTASRAGAASGTPVEALFLEPGISLISLRAVSGDPVTAELDVSWLSAEM